MPKPYFVLTPCGTSILTNVAGGNRGLVMKHANAKQWDAIPDEPRAALQEVVALAKRKLSTASLEEAKKASAELNTLIHLYDHQLENHPSDLHFLLSTDTCMGRATAEIIQEWLKTRGLNAQAYAPSDLQTADLQAFRLALSDIVRWCDETITPVRQNYRVIFNLTGGFKSIQGFLQTLAQFYADETVYIFESAEGLLRIPRLPGLPNSLEPEANLREYLQPMRRLALGLTVVDSSALPDMFILELEGESGLTVWGDVVWKKARPAIYKETFWPPPSAQIRYSDAFEKEARHLDGNCWLDLNTRMDQLAAYLEMESHPNPNSLDFKPLKGKSKFPSTHEMDAWADKGGWRIFAHYDGDILVLDNLGPGLH